MKNKTKQGYKFCLSVILVLLIQSPILAEASNKSSAAMVADVIAATAALIGVGAIVYLFNLGFTILEIEKRKLYLKKGIPLPAPKPKSNFWANLYKRATNTVPVHKEADIMLDHNYDGIQELDNSLPPWWVAMFYLTIAIGTIYFSYYHIYDLGLSSSESYALEMERADRVKARFLEKQANSIDESNVAALLDEASIQEGLAIYTSTCATCHGKAGEGGAGPNLTDEYWLHGADMKSVFSTIKYGVPEKGMIAWRTQLRPSDIHKVASYVMKLQGTNPPNPKAPQGEKIELKEESTSTDNATNQLGTN